MNNLDYSAHNLHLVKQIIHYSFLFFHLIILMHLMSLYIDCRERTSRAKILTCSAANASSLIHRRNHWL